MLKAASNFHDAIKEDRQNKLAQVSLSISCENRALRKAFLAINGEQVPLQQVPCYVIYSDVLAPFKKHLICIRTPFIAECRSIPTKTSIFESLLVCNNTSFITFFKVLSALPQKNENKLKVIKSVQF